MSEPDDDFVRRERITDALLAFECRIRERTLPLSRAECWDVLLNRLPSHGADPPGRAVLVPPLAYETRLGITLLRLRDRWALNRACLGCDLFGRSHCGGGLVFLYYALRDAGVKDPLSWLAVEVEPDLYMPDWELMADNSASIARKLRDFFEGHLEYVSAEPDRGQAPF